MSVTVRFFAACREATGLRETRVSVEPGSTVGELVDRLTVTYPALRPQRRSMLLAVNEEFADSGSALKEGDVVALMPPVSGGAPLIEIQRTAIDIEAVVEAVHRREAGATVLFLGTVRSDPGVRALGYEVYRPMALRKMNDIAERARRKFGVLEVAIVHRLGRVPVGRPSVAIACSAPHRQEAFQACQWSMEQVKKIVPIWKTEREQ